MTTSWPAATLPAEPARRTQRPLAKADGSWRYERRAPSRSTLAVAILLSAGLHAFLLLGFSKGGKKVTVQKSEHVIAISLVMPEVKELEEPEPMPTDESAPPVDLAIPVPMQQDLPQIPKPSDFVQPLNFASLLEQPDFSQVQILAIPENIRRGGKLAEQFGAIFNLADLDREPVPVFQPAPIVPLAMKRDGVSGTVRIEFIVDVNGRVLHPVVVESSDSRLNEAAMNGVAKWKFRPGIKHGQKVNTRMGVPIVFTLLDGTE
jgi:periplasmic protein TonB